METCKKGTSCSLSEGQDPPTDQIWPTTYFCTVPKLKTVFIFLNDLFEDKITFRAMWTLYEIQISMSVDKALLKHGHAHSFMGCPWLISCNGGRVELQQQRLCVSQSLDYLLFTSLKNKFADHCPRGSDAWSKSWRMGGWKGQGEVCFAGWTKISASSRRMQELQSTITTQVIFGPVEDRLPDDLIGESTRE